MNAGHHATEQQLESYSLGTLPEGEIEPLEEHLLICQDCQDLLVEADEYVSAMRAAVQGLETQPVAASPSPWSRLLGWLWRPLPALGIASACALLLLLLHPGFLGPAAVPATVMLEATRGDAAGGPATPAGKPIRLQLDLTGMAALPSYRLELADSAGATVAGSEVRAAADGVAWNLAPLAAGRYWVRVYEPGPGGRLLREFALPVE
jgi:hypothetical protein